MRISIDCPQNHKQGQQTVSLTADLSIFGVFADSFQVGGHAHLPPLVLTCPVGGEQYRIGPAEGLVVEVVAL